MVTNIFYTTILSLIIIILLHHFFIYFKQNLTTPKIKDLVNQPIRQYNEIYDIINTDKPAASDNKVTEGGEDMKMELKNYMKNLSSQLINEPTASIEPTASNEGSNYFSTI